MLATLVVSGGAVACGRAPDRGDAASDGAASDTAIRTWPCPAGWVGHARGGCAPAWWVCARDAESAADACTGIDPSRPALVPAEDGGTAPSLFVGADGGVRGAWPEDDAPNAPPAYDWVPDGGTGNTPLEWRPTAGPSSCPTDWTRAADGRCDPRLRSDCGPESAALPGAACVRTDSSGCPAGEYADPGADAVGATVVHVREGADPATADGSVARPFATITAGLGAAGGLGWVLVAAGRYTENVMITAGAHVLGVCAPRVTIAALVSTAATVSVDGARAVLDLRGATIVGSAGGLRAGNGARALLQQCRVQQTSGPLVWTFGAGSRIDLTECVVGDGAPATASAFGLLAQTGASIVATRIAVERAREHAVFANGGGSRIELRDSSVASTQAGADGAAGYGIVAGGGAVVRAERVSLRDNLGTHAFSGGVGSLVELFDASLSVMRRSPVGGDGYAVTAQQSARVTLRNLSVDASIGAGVFVNTSGQITADGVTIARTLPGGRGQGHGIGVDRAGSFDGRGVRVLQSIGAGVSVAQPMSTLTLRDSVVERTVPRAARDTGQGVLVQLGGRFVADHVLIADARAQGVLVTDAGSSGRMVDSVVRGTRPSDPMAGYDGTGVMAQETAVLDAERISIVDNTVWSLLAATRARVAVRAAVLRDAMPNGAGQLGGGVGVAAGARVELSLARIERNREVGVLVHAGDSSVSLSDSIIRASLGRPDGRFGRGLEVHGPARIDLARVRVEECHGSGLTALGSGGVAIARDVVFRASTEESPDLGVGVLAYGGGDITLWRAMVERQRNTGAAAWHSGAVLRAHDVVVRDMSMLGGTYGWGVAALDDGHVDAERLVVLHAHGVGLLATPAIGGRRGDSRLTASDAFVWGITTAQLDPLNPRTVAYAVYARGGGNVSLERALLARAGFGLFNDASTISVVAGVVDGMLDAAGAESPGTAAGATTLRDVALRGNARDEIVRIDGLPGTSSLPEPTPVCAAAPCD